MYENSPHLAAIEDFVDDTTAIIRVGRNVTRANLLRYVEIGLVDAAVVDAARLEHILATHADLQAGMSIPSPYRYRWAIRGTDRNLAAEVDSFLQEEYRKATYNVLERRYTNKPHSRSNIYAGISPYDDLLRSYADKYGFDWRLIAAQMYQESHFDPQATSTAGAIGLMQLMPATASALGFADPTEPETGIHAGIKYLHQLRDRFGSDIPASERTWLALAAYNIGFDRVRRARDRAQEMGLDPGKWFGNVEVAMREMNGRGCACGQAIIYVRAVRSLYFAYRNLKLAAELEPGPDANTG